MDIESLINYIENLENENFDSFCKSKDKDKNEDFLTGYLKALKEVKNHLKNIENETI